MIDRKQALDVSEKTLKMYGLLMLAEEIVDAIMALPGAELIGRDLPCEPGHHEPAMENGYHFCSRCGHSLTPEGKEAITELQKELEAKDRSVLMLTEEQQYQRDEIVRKSEVIGGLHRELERLRATERAAAELITQWRCRRDTIKEMENLRAVISSR